ncbi:Glyoxylase, beta-lactamase superfamily II [Candidatus Desulfarcum epimagneticum]|uniref:Glyoxylase, beta-lactamase superfamily II n=1 Tax=uncultured Desulfobacteraceae bacterium TaxID=218296 RepID=A0A484HEY1_9BACT|nr:Glyoxylase, beta-lactamase superfamily II [uncultured Desulfobacteraceae bacterium]
MKRTALTDQIVYIEPASMSAFRACSGLIVSTPGKKILIDANMGLDETADLLKQERPDMAIVSHYHLDHGTWGSRVLEHSQAELLIPKGEEKYLSSLPYFVERTAGARGLDEKWEAFSVNETAYREVTDFSTYDHGESFGAEVKMRAVKTSGHSPSHMSFYFPDEKTLFTGDMGIDPFGPWYGWEDCDLKDLMESIFRLKEMDVKILLTSHGGIRASKIQESWDWALGQIMERERMIDDMLERGAGRDDIVEKGIFFKNKSNVKEPMRSFLYMWDDIMLGHHLDLLNDGGISYFFPGIKEK